MQRRSVSRLEPDMILASDVLNNDGRLLLKGGTPLAVTHIQTLRGMFQAVLIKRDGFDDTLALASFADEVLRFELVKKIEAVYCTLYSLYYSVLGSPGKDSLSPPRPLSGMAYEYKDVNKMDGALRSVARVILNDVVEKRYALMSFNLPSPKHRGLYVFEHSVQSAVVLSRMLEESYISGNFDYKENGVPRSLPFDEKRFEDVIMATLMAEIGMLSIPVEILSKPTFDDLDKQNYLHPHANISRELAKMLPSMSPVAVAIVAAHHERRDGTGYPKMVSDFHPLTDPSIVANSYDAMVSSRPQHSELGEARDDKAMPPSEAMKVLWEMDQMGAFNGGTVDLLDSMVIPYPFGTTLVLTNGDVGLVADCTDKVTPHRMKRPLVRCAQNIRSGKRGLWDVDLSENPDIVISHALYS